MERRAGTTVSDRDRRDLYEVLERRLGGGPVNTMTELLPPVGRAVKLA